MNIYHHPFEQEERQERECHRPERGDCPTWGLWTLALALALFSHFAGAVVAPTCVLTTTSQTVKAQSPATLALTFSSTNAASCTATSTGNQTAWTGSKALTGAQILTGIKQSADYTYTCAGTPLSVGSALLSWMPPTLNTDGSILKDLGSYKLYWGATALGVMANKATVSDPTVLVYTVTDLPPGLTYFAASSVNAGGIEGPLSTAISKTITVPAPLTCSQTVHIDVVTVPNPPSNLTVTDPIAYEVIKTTDAIKLAAIGTVALGVNCKPEYDANGLNVVPRNLVKFTSATKPLVVVAKCG
jgi:hypothetical protein